MFTSTLRHVAGLLLLAGLPFVSNAIVTVNGTVILDFDNTFSSSTGTDGGGLVAVLYSNITGDVVAAEVINADGTFSITAANGDYSIMITSEVPGIADPADPPVLNANWASTAEGPSYGDVTPDAIIDLGLATDITLDNVDFGIEELPLSDNYLTTIPQPTGGDVISTDGTGDNPSPLSGSDAEDGTLGSGSSLIIDSIPANAILSYSGTPLSAGDAISGYDPAELQITFTAVSLGSTSVTFWFRFVDAANLASTEMAYYTVQWDDPLPVTMISLNANARNNMAVLSWKTLSEVNNKGFAVQRSTNGNSWENIGFLPSLAINGNSDGELQYEYTDAQPGAQNYYRLQQTDLDGKTKYSNIATLNLKQMVNINVYPNPAVHMLQVSGVQPGNRIQLLDLNGRIVYNAIAVAANNIEVIDMNGKTSGNYILQLYSNGQLLQSVKIVKE